MLADDIILAAIQSFAHARQDAFLQIRRNTDSQSFGQLPARTRALSRSAAFFNHWYVDESHGGWSLQDHTAPNRDRPAPPPSPGATTWARASRIPDDPSAALVRPERTAPPAQQDATGGHIIVQDHPAHHHAPPPPLPGSPGPALQAEARHLPRSPRLLAQPDDAGDALHEFAAAFFADREFYEHEQLFDDWTDDLDVLDALGGPPDLDPPSPQ